MQCNNNCNYGSNYKLHTVAAHQIQQSIFLGGYDWAFWSLTFFKYRIGEVFIHLTSDETQELLDKAKAQAEEEIKSLEAQSKDIKVLLAELKVKLYATFGDNINLEADEE